jgi:hypothetical protein
MRAAILQLLASTVFAACSMASSQTKPLLVHGREYDLGNPHVVGPAETALWSPDSGDLLYTASEQDRTIVGVYSMKSGKGAIVARLEPAEHLEQTLWLNHGHLAMLVTRRDVEGRDKPAELLAIRVANADELRCQELWAKEYPKSAAPKLEIKPSPTLAHALVSVRSIDGNLFLVLTEGAKSIVTSSDIAEVEKLGQDLTGWSVNGTAIFSLSQPGWFQSGGRSATVSSGGNPGAFFNQANMTVDEVTLECVPANGVLRPIRFPGLFVPPDSQALAVKARVQVTELRAGGESAQVNSLWLDGDTGSSLLVSAEAGAAWVAPTGRAVAFLCHGALFVQAIQVVPHAQ